jgi:hypothetical protein
MEARRPKQLMIQDEVHLVGAVCTTSVSFVGQVDRERDADLGLLLDHVGKRELAGCVLAANSAPDAKSEPTKVRKRKRAQKPRHLRCLAPGHRVL